MVEGETTFYSALEWLQTSTKLVEEFKNYLDRGFQI